MTNMLQKIKLALLPLASLFVMAVPMAAGGIASAQQAGNNIPLGPEAACGTNLTLTTGQTCDTGNASDKVSQFIATVINVASIIVGVAAVIMIIVGGFRYVTSGGKQESVSAAKTTILYALVGLVVVALAQIIVHFVLEKANTGTGQA